MKYVKLFKFYWEKGEISLSNGIYRNFIQTYMLRDLMGELEKHIFSFRIFSSLAIPN